MRLMNLSVEEHEVQEIEEKDDLARMRHISEILRREKPPWYLLDK